MTAGPFVVPEGEQINRTATGVVLVAEWSRPVTVECDCGAGLQLRVCADAPVSDSVCDSVLDEYLRGLGWSVSFIARGDVCPECVGRQP